MKELSTLNDSLVDLQKKCTGMFLLKYTKDWVYVIEHIGPDKIVCVSMKDFLGVKTEFAHKSSGDYLAFPDGDNLFDMLQDPQYFHHWFTKHITNHKPSPVNELREVDWIGV